MANATDHLWMHFTRMSSYRDGEVPTIVRGEGAYVWDDQGRRYLDGLSGLFVVNAGFVWMRHYTLSWLGERVVTDLRGLVFDRNHGYVRGASACPVAD